MISIISLFWWDGQNAYHELKKSTLGAQKLAEIFKAQTDIRVSHKLQLFWRKKQFLLDRKMNGRKGAWALRKDAILVKGQTWAALQSMRGILTDFEPLKLSLIALNSDKEQTKNYFGKLALFWLLFFCFHLRAANPFGISGKLNLLITEIFMKF